MNKVIKGIIQGALGIYILAQDLNSRVCGCLCDEAIMVHMV
jgi:hypothetical protein